MIKPPDIVVNLVRIDLHDSDYIDGNVANLGHISNNLPLAPGFVLTPKAHKDFMENNNLDGKIGNLLSSANFEIPESIVQSIINIKHEIMRSDIPGIIASSVLDQVKNISSSEPFSFRLRTANSSKSDSLSTKENLLDEIKYIWSSNYNRESLGRFKNFEDLKQYITILVQAVPRDSVTGVIFPFDSKGDFSKITIMLTKGYFLIIDRTNQYILLESPEGLTHIKKGEYPSALDLFTKTDIALIIDIVDIIEKKFSSPQQIEFVKSHKNFLITGIKRAEGIFREDIYAKN